MRTLFVLLILLNLGYAAWTQGWLAELGAWAQPHRQEEPHRLAAQINPDQIQLLAADAPEISAPVLLGQAAVVLSATDDAPPNDRPTDASPDNTTNTTNTNNGNDGVGCQQTASFSEKDRPRMAALFKAALPEDSWRMVAVSQPARWIVYTGKLSGPEALAETKAQLRQLKIGYRDVPAALQPGLALGTFYNEESAQQGVRDVARNGYKGAKAVMERAEYDIYTLRLPQATDELKAKAAAVLTKHGDGKAAKSWQSCDRDA